MMQMNVLNLGLELDTCFSCVHKHYTWKCLEITQFNCGPRTWWRANISGSNGRVASPYLKKILKHNSNNFSAIIAVHPDFSAANV